MKNFFVFLMSVSVLSSMFSFSGKPANAQQTCYILASSHKTFENARVFALSINAGLSAEIRLANNGFYAVIVDQIDGKRGDARVQERINALVSADMIPSDAYCSSSAAYGDVRPYAKIHAGWRDTVSSFFNNQSIWLPILGLLIFAIIMWRFVKRRKTTSEPAEETRKYGSSTLTPREVRTNLEKQARATVGKRKKSPKPRKPKTLGVAPTVFVGGFSLLLLWVADHAVIVADDIHWVLMVLFIALPLAIGPLWLFSRQRRKGLDRRGKHPSNVRNFDRLALFATGFVAPIVLIINAFSHSSFLSPAAHSAELHNKFQSVETVLAADYPSLFGPDANDRRLAQKIIDDKIAADLAAEQKLKNRVVEERLAREKQAAINFAVVRMQGDYERANKYWPRIAANFDNYSGCIREYRKPAGTQMNVRSLNDSIERGIKYKDCTLNFAKRNSPRYVNEYNDLVDTYLLAVKAASLRGTVPDLSYVKQVHFMNMVIQDITNPYVDELNEYKRANLQVAKRNTRDSQRPERRTISLMSPQQRARQQRSRQQRFGDVPSHGSGTSQFGTGTHVPSPRTGDAVNGVNKTYRYTSCGRDADPWSNLSSYGACNDAQERDHPNTIFIDRCTGDAKYCRDSWERLQKVEKIPPQGTVILPSLPGYGD